MPAVTVVCRQANLEDVEPLYLMIEEYARKGIMLPRSREVLRRQIDNFVVAEEDGKVIGCGSLCLLGPDLVEIRSLGIMDGNKGKGVGSKLVDRLIELAIEQGIPKIIALTYEVSFFVKNGFTVVPMDVFPEKVWTDCIHCAKRDRCDEIAVLKVIG
ncbi:N-acetyltransferase [Saccharibacillus endophyticus]|uniref:GCN5 family acetyltransferase n=1 Tax=Saccharibacillus endophyticus TaxID=2060666 RepID=A0ABQ1ZQ37_9BACL|nr:N-acetyltransferase [Saccharibacillus endophyticus]GGH74380.1 GCN5 family acetyltransferase [Saccharibacillus endophyticus]